MINPEKCNLYKLSSKRYLKILLKIPNNNFLKQEYVAKQFNPYIDSKPRLIEAPSDSLKKIQTVMKKELNKIHVPDNIFSGIKGRSYIHNAKLHRHNKFLFKLDLTAFFPCITRETVYKFFKNDLKTSPDIANILTNFTTVDLALCDIKNVKKVERFLQYKGVKTTNHLISGSPTSQILSYLVNHKMFDEIQYFCNLNGITMSIYVDDITFSSPFNISYKHKKIIYTIISKHFYKLARNKTKYYTGNYPKYVTGSIICSDGTLKTPNALSRKVISELKYYKDHPEDTKSLQRLRGLVIASKQNEPEIFENIYKLVCNASKS